MKQANHPHAAASIEKAKGPGRRGSKRGTPVTEARARAQRAKLDAQAEARHEQEEQAEALRPPRSKKAARQERQARQRTLDSLIEAYMQDHIGGNHSDKTLEWHRTALGLLQRFLQEELDVTAVDEIEADDISAWFAHMRTTPGANGKVRCERIIQTYARSARAFFH